MKLNCLVKRLITFAVVIIPISYFFISYVLLPFSNSMQHQLYEMETNQTYAQQVANQCSQIANQINQTLQSPVTWLIIVLEINFVALIVVLSQRR